MISINFLCKPIELYIIINTRSLRQTLRRTNERSDEQNRIDYVRYHLDATFYIDSIWFAASLATIECVSFLFSNSHIALIYSAISYSFLRFDWRTMSHSTDHNLVVTIITTMIMVLGNSCSETGTASKMCDSFSVVAAVSRCYTISFSMYSIIKFECFCEMTFYKMLNVPITKHFPMKSIIHTHLFIFLVFFSQNKRRNI